MPILNVTCIAMIFNVDKLKLPVKNNIFKWWQMNCQLSQFFEMDNFKWFTKINWTYKCHSLMPSLSILNWTCIAMIFNADELKSLAKINTFKCRHKWIFKSESTYETDNFNRFTKIKWTLIWKCIAMIFNVDELKSPAKITFKWRHESLNQSTFLNGPFDSPK